MNVGIRELKAHLSEYVDKASRGEHITVTDRGKPVAQLVSLGGTSLLENGIEEGWVTPPSQRGLGPAARFKSALTTAEVLDEDRG